MTPMTPAERQSVAGPYRETFLAGLRPDVAAALQQSGDYSESAMYEVYGAEPGDIPFDILFSRAALVDLEALIDHLTNLVRDTAGDDRFRDGLTESLSLLRRTAGQLAATIKEAEARRVADWTKEADA